MPVRINKAIELLEQDQPVYYVGSHTGEEMSYQAGKRLAKTFADYINVGMEHGSFDMAGLDQFMRGLVDGGPTNSGHRTPAVIVEVPVDGGSEHRQGKRLAVQADTRQGGSWAYSLPRRDARRRQSICRVVPIPIQN